MFGATLLLLLDNPSNAAPSGPSVASVGFIGPFGWLLPLAGGGGAAVARYAGPTLILADITPATGRPDPDKALVTPG